MCSISVEDVFSITLYLSNAKVLSKCGESLLFPIALLWKISIHHRPFMCYHVFHQNQGCFLALMQFEIIVTRHLDVIAASSRLAALYLYQLSGREYKIIVLEMMK